MIKFFVQINHKIKDFKFRRTLWIAKYFFSKICIYIFIFLLCFFFFIFWLFRNIYISSELFDFNTSDINSKHQKYLLSDNIYIWLVEKIIKIEDHRFWSNSIWIDFGRFVKSIYNNINWNKIQWWSTIDQQLIKISNNDYINRNIYTKIKEIFAAIKLNFVYKKRNILIAYLNNVPMTNNIIWIKSACNIYMAKSCENLSESEQYFIISIYQLGINPYNIDNFNKIKKRSKFLCTYFGWSDCDNIYNYEPISHNSLWKYANDINPVVFHDIYDLDKFDINIYDNNQSIINNVKPHLVNKEISDCCVVILNWSWDLLSMNICRPSLDKTSWWKINICNTKRQTGSAIKPFLYILGMKKLALSGSSYILDEPITYFLQNNNEYQPKNFDLKYHGNVTIAQALGNSLNIPAVKVLHDIWLDSFEDFLLQNRYIYHLQNQLTGDIHDDHNRQIANDLWLSMALGTYNFTPLEFTNLRRIFLAKTSKSENIDNIYNKNILTWYEFETNSVYDILSDNANRLVSFGPANWLDVKWRMVKSGTSRHFVDWRTCGANREMDRVVCVWVGNFDNRPATDSSSQTASLLRNLVVKNLR